MVLVLVHHLLSLPVLLVLRSTRATGVNWTAMAVVVASHVMAYRTSHLHPQRTRT
jgi:hypothetical protein